MESTINELSVGDKFKFELIPQALTLVVVVCLVGPGCFEFNTDNEYGISTRIYYSAQAFYAVGYGDLHLKTDAALWWPIVFTICFTPIVGATSVSVVQVLTDLFFLLFFKKRRCDPRWALVVMFGLCLFSGLVAFSLFWILYDMTPESAALCVITTMTTSGIQGPPVDKVVSEEEDWFPEALGVSAIVMCCVPLYQTFVLRVRTIVFNYVRDKNKNNNNNNNKNYYYYGYWWLGCEGVLFVLAVTTAGLFFSPAWGQGLPQNNTFWDALFYGVQALLNIGYGLIEINSQYPWTTTGIIITNTLFGFCFKTARLLAVKFFFSFLSAMSTQKGTHWVVFVVLFLSLGSCVWYVSAVEYDHNGGDYARAAMFIASTVTTSGIQAPSTSILPLTATRSIFLSAFMTSAVTVYEAAVAWCADFLSNESNESNESNDKRAKTTTKKHLFLFVHVVCVLFALFAMIAWVLTFVLHENMTHAWSQAALFAASVQCLLCLSLLQESAQYVNRWYVVAFVSIAALVVHVYVANTVVKIASSGGVVLLATGTFLSELVPEGGRPVPEAEAQVIRKEVAAKRKNLITMAGHSRQRRERNSYV
jgi:hypothetical protein